MAMNGRNHFIGSYLFYIINGRNNLIVQIQEENPILVAFIKLKWGQFHYIRNGEV